MRFYTTNHTWLEQVAPGKFAVGLSEFAKEMMGGVEYIDRPHVHVLYKELDIFAEVESAKEVATVEMPVGAGGTCTGEVEPEDALGVFEGTFSTDGLMSEEEYAEYIRQRRKSNDNG